MLLFCEFLSDGSVCNKVSAVNVRFCVSYLIDNVCVVCLLFFKRVWKDEERQQLLLTVNESVPSSIYLDIERNLNTHRKFDIDKTTQASHFRH